MGRGRCSSPLLPPQSLLLSPLSCSPHLLGSSLYPTVGLLRFPIVLHSVVPISIPVVPPRPTISWPAPLTPHVLFGRRRTVAWRSTCTGSTAELTCPPGAPAPPLTSSSGQLTTGLHGVYTVYGLRQFMKTEGRSHCGPKVPWAHGFPWVVRSRWSYSGRRWSYRDTRSSGGTMDHPAMGPWWPRHRSRPGVGSL